ncbi:MAG: cell division protein FtsL [Bdellovibrionales bacterium]|nr:cell division protein FtsL [Bdellovibrionales bacterium]
MKLLFKNKLLWVAILLVLTLFYVRARFLTVELSYDVQNLRQMKLDLEDQKRKYLLELSTLQNPKRIETLAKEKFSLGYQKENSSTVYVQE